MNINEKFEGQNDLLSLLPKKVRESSELTKNAKLVLADLILLCGTDYANENGCCYRSNEDLMKDTHIKSHNTLSSCLTKLCGLGYITRKSGVRGQASTYCINYNMLEIEKPTQGGDKNVTNDTVVTTDKNVTIDNVLDEIRILKDTVNSLYEYIRVNLGVKNDNIDVNLGVNSDKIGYGLGYDSDKIDVNLSVKNDKLTLNCNENCPTDTDIEKEKDIVVYSNTTGSYSDNDSSEGYFIDECEFELVDDVYKRKVLPVTAVYEMLSKLETLTGEEQRDYYTHCQLLLAEYGTSATRDVWDSTPKELKDDPSDTIIVKVEEGGSGLTDDELTNIIRQVNSDELSIVDAKERVSIHGNEKQLKRLFAETL